MLADQTAKYNQLYNTVVVDMKYVFRDAVDVKVEHYSDIEKDAVDQQHSENVNTFWQDARLKIDYVKTERGSMQFYRDSFIKVMRAAVSQVFVKRWAKPSISTFIKDIYFSKEGFFTKDQIAELDDIMSDLNNETAASVRMPV